MSADDFLLTSLDMPTATADVAAHHATITGHELEPLAPAAALGTVQINGALHFRRQYIGREKEVAMKPRWPPKRKRWKQQTEAEINLINTARQFVRFMLPHLSQNQRDQIVKKIYGLMRSALPKSPKPPR